MDIYSFLHKINRISRNTIKISNKIKLVFLSLCIGISFIMFVPEITRYSNQTANAQTFVEAEDIVELDEDVTKIKNTAYRLIPELKLERLLDENIVQHNTQTTEESDTYEPDLVEEPQLVFSNQESKAMLENNLYNIISKTPTEVDISEAKSTTNNQAVSKPDYETPAADIIDTSASVASDESTDLFMVFNSDMIIELSETEIFILERIVEAEAGGEGIYGKMLVANVVLNRVNHKKFPDTVKAVVFQKGQFSPISDGRYDKVSITKETKEAVAKVLAGEDYSKGALYFFARSKTSNKKAAWFDNCLRKVLKYKGHEFFTES